MEGELVGAATAFPTRPFSTERDVASGRNELRIHIDRVDGVLVITPVGDIDIVSGGLFLESLIAAISAGESRLIVNLQQVPFMDSTGLAIFASVDRALRTVDGQLRLIGGPQLASILKLGAVDRTFPIDATVGDAVARLAVPLPRQA